MAIGPTTGYRSGKSMYDAFLKSNGESINNKVEFEDEQFFRSDLSRYSIINDKLIAGSSCKWTGENYGGIPLDYLPTEKEIFVDGSDNHTMIIGSTGSKKSRLLAMPTIRLLASSNESMVICDPKGEIYQRTAAFLNDSSYKVYAINLREPNKGDGWNMLDIPYNLYLNGEIDKSCELINDITINLVPITAKDPYWDFSARDMLFGLILLLFKICKEKELKSDAVNMAGVLKLKEELFSSTESSVIKRSNIWKFAEQDSLVRTRLNGTVICPEKTLACIISTFDQHLSCFSMQPQIIDLLSKTTFSVNSMGFKKMAIYLIMPDEKSTYHKIITIFLKQIYEILIDNAYKLTSENKFPERINFVLDEFSSLPTISDFPQMITASRSRNIRFVLIVQSKHQLVKRYAEETETIMANCGNWIFLTSRELPLLQEISELGGYTENKTPLISVAWLQHLDKEKGECLVFNGRKKPYVGHVPDISEYDKDAYTFLEMRLRATNGDLISSYSTHYFEDLLASPKIPEEERINIQKELEAKFDELFGPLDDDN